jgi:hypothetical protein
MNGSQSFCTIYAKSHNAARESNATRARHCCSSRKIHKNIRVKDQNILFDFSPQVQTLLPTLSQILYFHLRIYVFRQYGDTQNTFTERMT